MKKAFSPHSAVFGHDTTHIPRVTLEEYQRELRAEAAALEGHGISQPEKGPLSEPQCAERRPAAEERRVGLSARNPNVVFSSKYPVYDRLGRELCVAHQCQDMMVQQELRRLEQERHGGHDCRRSGVRLSAELPLSSDGTATRPSSVAATQPPSPADEREHAFATEALGVARASPADGDSAVDVEVSATSHYPSASASRTSSRPASARPSEFSIFRESGAAVAVGTDRARKAHSTIPLRTVAEEDKILVRGGTADDGPRATSLPFSSGGAGAAALHGRGWRLGAEKRRRSHSAGGRLSRVRFLSEEDGDAVGGVARGRASPDSEKKEPPARGTTSALPPRLGTPPPVPLSDADVKETHDGEVAEATRWTTLARGSAAVRATKQLFRPTTQSNNAARMTTTLSYSNLISSNAYGFTAPAISASKVCDAVEQNVLACTAAMPQQYTEGCDVEASSASHQSTPELRCGSVVQLGSRFYRIEHFYAVAEVYEAVCVSATAAEDTACPVEDEPLQKSDGWVLGKPAEKDRGVNAMQAHEDDQMAEATARDSTPPRAEGTSQSTCHAAAADKMHDAAPQLRQQIFLYRWRSTDNTHRFHEARRAALGLSLFAPHAHVTGFTYADGGGVTLVTMPAGHRAVPLSTLPLSLRSFTTLLRTVLKAFAAMVARRTVHGSLAALGELFLVWPGEEPSCPSDQATSLQGEHGVGCDAPERRPQEPYVVAFHWERWVDFGMFVDRNAGRTLPFDFEDNTAQPLVLHGKDLLAGLQLFLEHPLAAQLSSEQYILLQKLVVLAAEPTPVAIHLIQLKNLMLTLPADTAALGKSVQSALVHHADA